MNPIVNLYTTGSDDNFGGSVSLVGDVLAVGALSEDSAATSVNGGDVGPGNQEGFDTGAAYVFKRSTTGWSQEAYLKTSNPYLAGTATNRTDVFGFSVALSEVGLVVGAKWEDSDAVGIDGDQENDLVTNSGAIYIFR